MAHTLLIHYNPGNTEQVSWCILGDNGQLQGSISHGSLDDIDATSKTRRARVLLDASCTSIESVMIPSNNRQRQLQAVPFALEDSLASDIDDMYFALGKKLANDTIPVVTIDRQLFESTIDHFRQAGIFVENMAPDCLALPLQNAGWSVLLYGENVLVKTSPHHGYFCDRDILPTLLPSLLKQDKQAPQSLNVFHHQEDDQAGELFASLDVALNIQPYAQHPLEVFASNLHDPGELNLLQGKYAPRRESLALLQPWKAVAAVAAVFIILQLIYAGFEIRQLQYRNQQLTGEIEQLFGRINPGTRNFSNIQTRMKRQLSELQGGGNGDDDIFLELLAGAANAFDTRQITIQGMVYNNKHVDMELHAQSLQALESAKNQLNSMSTIKTTLSTSVEGDKVKGRLRLEKQG